MDKSLPKKLRVMADYSSSGIWVMESMLGFRHGMVDYGSLGLPEDLANRFKRWINIHDNNLSDKGLNLEDFDKMGLQLAKDLKKFLGTDAYVEYEPEKSDFGAAMMKVLEREIEKELKDFKGSKEEYSRAYSQTQDRIMSDPKVRKELEELKVKFSGTVVI